MGACVCVKVCKRTKMELMEPGLHTYPPPVVNLHSYPLVFCHNNVVFLVTHVYKKLSIISF